jgi:hypothetical protein
MHVQQETHNCCHNPPDAKKRDEELKKQNKFQIMFYDTECMVVEENDKGTLEVYDLC